MAPPSNPTQNRGVGADPPRENPPSNNLWIGNVSPEVSEVELRSIFERHGKLDSVSTYPSRSYAFICFKDLDGAKSARQGLQGYALHGNSLKIEFAKPAKPCKSLWVAGIGPSISKEELEKEFLRYGKIQEFRFLKDRNTAYVDYVGLENATQALKNLNGKRFGGSQIRVDFLRSQSSKRELGPDAKEGQFSSRNVAPDIRWMGQDSLNNFPEPSLSGPKRKNQFLLIGPQFGDGLPTKVLWIRHPPSVILEEDMLHNAMILFGEIERIKTFSDRNYAFVEFRSVEEARQAKEGLQGKLFNDPRILIDYFSDEFPGARGPAGEHPFQPVQMDMIGLNRPVLVGNNPGRPSSFGIHGPDLYMRPPPVGPHSTFDPAHHGPEFMDLAAVHKLQNHSPKAQLGGPAWRRSPPAPGLVSSPSAGFNVPSNSASAAWDVFDGNQRESKRSRFDAALPPEITENQGEQYRPHSVRGGGASGSLIRGTVGGLGRRHMESDCIWRGLIAKGGTPVCRARCVPVGEGLGADIPDVVNCSARTGLDLLSKHYDDAIGFGIVSFLPDSEEDFASYTEFLRYLGSKDRAGVAKFDDGTTLFLVPPSDFLANVLDVHGPPRLYGVVLKFPQAVPSSPALNPQSIPPRYADPPNTLQRGYGDPPKLPTLQRSYGAITPEERGIHLDNSRVLPDDFKLPPKAPAPVTNSFSGHVVPPTTGASQAGLALTPELIATLTSLLPANNGSSGPQTSLLPQAPTVASGVDTNFAHWKHENQAPDHSGHLQQWSGQINSQLQHQQTAPIVSSTAGQLHQTLNPYSQFHDHRNNFSPQGAPSSRPMAPVNPLQNGPEMNQHYQQRSSQDVFRGQRFDNVSDSPRSYNPSIHQQPPAYPVASSNQMHANAVHVPQPYIPQPSEVEPTHQSQLLQTAPFGGVTQENAETEADKNERYKTTLLFAANLLSRIHQPSGNQPGQGAGSH
ncbi:flowering time control protein fpa [Phtheirospermum japonicum]|uniref:Flowering time control protein fpa n=1 Tax=Phtheirospermum japonicum TaxID=374723 RepID=A0A830C8C1_9LAMI|nr:flowering time control protein fpa [Phtheirospermum japonicum]